MVDGAFTSRAESARHIALLADYDGVVHLRSFGKFFGIAGLRLGFAIGTPEITAGLTAMLGPWAINAAALSIGATALGDHAWADTHQHWLDAAARRLAELFKAHGLKVSGGCSLFQTVSDPRAHALHEHLAHHQIWTRKYRDFPTMVRCGIPATDSEFEALDRALGCWNG